VQLHFRYTIFLSRPRRDKFTFTKQPSQTNLLLIDFLKSWVGAVSVFSADEEHSAAKVFAKLCSDAVNTMNVVSRSGTVATAAAVHSVWHCQQNMKMLVVAFL